VLGSLLPAVSHVLEPLPPQVTRSPHWVPVAEYLFGAAGTYNSPVTVARRVGHLAAQTVFGTVDEPVASPRLLPVLLLDLLWRLGHDTARRSAWHAQAAQAIASGNPGLDFIGIGGATPLRTPARPTDPGTRSARGCRSADAELCAALPGRHRIHQSTGAVALIVRWPGRLER